MTAQFKHPFEPTMELWRMAAKGFPGIFSTGNRDSGPFPHRLPHKRNVSSHDKDEHLQVTQTMTNSTLRVRHCNS